MLELLMGGVVIKSATITPNTYEPKPGDTVTFTVNTKGIINERLYWSIISSSEINTGFSPQQSSMMITGNGAVTFKVVMPAKDENNFKTFRVGLSLVSLSEAASDITAMTTSLPLTMAELIPPVGQASFIYWSSSQNWTVPARVTKLSGVFISGGGSGGASTSGSSSPGGGGGGGALLYFNDYPVNPGDLFNVTMSAFNAGFTQPGSDGSAGHNLIVKHNNVTIATLTAGNGGGANGSAGAAGTVLSTATAFTPYVVKRNGSGGRNAANGGAGGYVGNYTTATPVYQNESMDGGTSNRNRGGGGSGGVGGVGVPGSPGGWRVIWGPDRSYPSNALDMPVVS